MDNRQDKSGNYDRGRHGKRNQRGNKFGGQRNDRNSSDQQKNDAMQTIHYQLDTPICAKCKEPITDLATALADKNTGEPLHFDCVLNLIKNSETLKSDERIVYIGQGRFAVAANDNPHDFKHVTIRRIIEWEEKDKKYEWRTNIANLYSQVK